MIRAAALILLLILGGCSTSLRSSPDELIIGTEGAYPPWNFTRPDGSLAGFEADYLRVLCARIHRPCRMVAMDWDGMIAALQTGKIDLIADAMQITPERAAVLDFGRPYAQTTGVIATLRTSPLAHLPDRDAELDFDRPGPTMDAIIDHLRRNLSGKVVGVQLSGAFDTFITNSLGPAVQIRYYRTMGERDLDLLAGRIDATIEDESYLVPLLATRDGAALVLAGPRMIGGSMGRGEALAFRKGDGALRTRFNAAIGSTMADGTLRRMQMQWFHLDATPPQGQAR